MTNATENANAMKTEKSLLVLVKKKIVGDTGKKASVGGEVRSWLQWFKE